MQFAPLAPAATFWHDAPHIENGRDMPDRLTGRYPDLGETLRAMDLEELRALAQDVIDECHARLPPEARDILSDEGVTPDHAAGSHDPDILDAAYLDAMEDAGGGAAPDLMAAARLSAAHRYAAEATAAEDLCEAVFEALTGANAEPRQVPQLARLLS